MSLLPKFLYLESIFFTLLLRFTTFFFDFFSIEMWNFSLFFSIIWVLNGVVFLCKQPYAMCMANPFLYIPNMNIGNVWDCALPLYVRRFVACVNVAVRCKYVCDNLCVCTFGSYRLPACVCVVCQTANKYLISKRLRRDFNFQIKNKRKSTYIIATKKD